VGHIDYIDSLILEAKSPKFKVGDKVKYAVKFLRSIGEYTGDMPRAKGIVTGLTGFGQDGKFLISIDWGNPDLPGKVLDSNLALVSDPEHSSY
jgi:hypothetical protein